MLFKTSHLEVLLRKWFPLSRVVSLRTTSHDELVQVTNKLKVQTC
jgi:hypothetical protein